MLESVTSGASTLIVISLLKVPYFTVTVLLPAVAESSSLATKVVIFAIVPSSNVAVTDISLTSYVSPTIMYPPL